MPSQLDADCDHIVIGAGAGGGVLAARLAEAGRHVVLLEAGGDPRQASDARLPEDYDVPAFHPFASENPALRWDFFVRHTADAHAQSRDPNFCVQHGGVLYPRSTGLGGCTAHNAMIFVAPPDADWDFIARVTGDSGWSGRAMQRHFRKIEDCHHRPLARLARRFGLNFTGHGWRGWLHTERAMPHAAFSDDSLLRTLLDSAHAALGAEKHELAALRQLLESHADPNDRRFARQGFEGLCYTPLSTRAHRRAAVRERLLEVAARYPERLQIETDALVTRIVLDESNTVTGVEYRKGAHLYRAHATPNAGAGEPRSKRCRGDVILAGGTFNTPQLLMLSGIGDPSALAAHGIAPRAALHGVGRNLQDRYEVGVVNRLAEPWSSLDGAHFTKGDRLYQAWQRGEGMYISNGSALAVTRRSATAGALPDLFCMALLAQFRGYFPGYSRLIAESHQYLTWAILKSYTRNRAGRITLRSADPRDPPDIQFNNFHDAGADKDIAAVVEGIRFARHLASHLHAQGVITEEELPGSHLETDEQLTQFVRDHAWGHHAAGSCPIGARAQGGVLDGALQVHGTRGLRVADASVFPRIPGAFIASAVMMVGERAAELILQE